MDKEKIQEQAKEILDKFVDALKNVEKEGKGLNIGVDREDFERIEGDVNDTDESFRESLLNNAPEHDEDHVLVERGAWK